MAGLENRMYHYRVKPDEALNLDDSGFPETEALSREVCSLPMNVEITDEEVDYVISVVLAFYGKR